MPSSASSGCGATTSTSSGAGGRRHCTSFTPSPRAAVQKRLLRGVNARPAAGLTGRASSNCAPCDVARPVSTGRRPASWPPADRLRADRPREVGPFQIGVAETGAPQIGLSKWAFGQVRPVETGYRKSQPRKSASRSSACWPAARQIEPAACRPSKSRPLQVALGQNRRGPRPRESRWQSSAARSQGSAPL